MIEKSKKITDARFTINSISIYYLLVMVGFGWPQKMK